MITWDNENTVYFTCLGEYIPTCFKTFNPDIDAIKLSLSDSLWSQEFLEVVLSLRALDKQLKSHRNWMNLMNALFENDDCSFLCLLRKISLFVEQTFVLRRRFFMFYFKSWLQWETMLNWDSPCNLFYSTVSVFGLRNEDTWKHLCTSIMINKSNQIYQHFKLIENYKKQTL